MLILVACLTYGVLCLQGEEEASSKAVNLLYAGDPVRAVDVLLQVPVAVGDDVVQAGEHQPRPVETGGEHDDTQTPGGVQQGRVEIIEISSPLLGDVFIKDTRRPILLYDSLLSVQLLEFLYADKLFSNCLEQIHQIHKYTKT